MREGMKKKILLVVFAVMAIFVWAHEETTSKPRPVPVPAPGNELSAEKKDATWTPLSVLGVPWNCDKTAGVDLLSYVESVYGFQVNLLRGAREAYGGQIGVFRNFAYELYGFQVGAINHMEGGCGLQLGALNFHNDNGNSVQIGFINAPFMRSNNGSGIQIGAWNFSEGGSRLQLGALNLAKDSACVQIGCVNSAWDYHLNPSSRKSCIQIGFLNFRNGNEFSPIIGWSF